MIVRRMRLRLSRPCLVITLALLLLKDRGGVITTERGELGVSMTTELLLLFISMINTYIFIA